MIRKSPYKRNEWPANDAGVVKKTPTATSLFGGGKMRSPQCGGTRTGAELTGKRWDTRDFWTARTP